MSNAEGYKRSKIDNHAIPGTQYCLPRKYHDDPFCATNSLRNGKGIKLIVDQVALTKAKTLLQESEQISADLPVGAAWPLLPVVNFYYYTLYSLC